MPPRRKIKIDDLYRFELVQGLAIAPDGKQVVYAVEHVDRATEQKFQNLFLTATDPGPDTATRQYTYGDHRDMHPRWAPDGKSIAFLSNRQNPQQYQLYLIPTDGGEARPLTEMTGTFGSVVWSPDARRIAFLFRLEPEQRSEDKIVSRRIARVFFKSNDEGFLPAQRWHLWVIDVATGSTTQLTDDDRYDEQAPVFSSDGERLCYLSNRSPDPDLDVFHRDIFSIPACGGAEARLDLPRGPKAHLGASPDGKWLSFVGYPGEGNWWRQKKLYLTTPEPPGELVNLTRDEDYIVASLTSGDLSNPEMVSPQWSGDGCYLYFQVSEHGKGLLKRVHLPSQRIENVVDEKGTVGLYEVSRSASRVALLLATPDDPGQVYALDPDPGLDLASGLDPDPGLEPDSGLDPNSGSGSGRKSRLTEMNRDFLDSVDLGRVEEVWFSGPGGDRVQGWIHTPPEFDPAQSYPSILQMHGGPKVQYGFMFMHEFAALAARGYVVYYCNPRGSEGYGEQFSRAITDNYGTVDFADVMAWTDYVEQQPYIDRRRMGVTGGSVGGLMTNWIIGHSHRFKAAVTQRTVSNLISTWGASCANWIHQYEFGEKPPWENFEQYWEQSPLKHVGHIKTPTLIIHSDADHQCEAEQAEQLFVALKYSGVETEMIRFPQENHNLSRSGRTDRRVDRIRHILRWFDTHL